LIGAHTNDEAGSFGTPLLFEDAAVRDLGCARMTLAGRASGRHGDPPQEYAT